MMHKPLLLLLSLLTTLPVSADVTTFGDYNIHHNAFNSDFLSPEVAGSYNLTRSNSRALLNVTVTMPRPDAPEQPVEAVVTGTATNLLQQRRQLAFREIRETDAIYYIAEFPITNELVLHFDIQASRNGQPIGDVKFTQTFYK